MYALHLRLTSRGSGSLDTDTDRGFQEILHLTNMTVHLGWEYPLFQGQRACGKPLPFLSFEAVACPFNL